MCSGDIVSGFASSTRALEGTRLHQKLQKAEKEGYEKEVAFKKEIPLEGQDALVCIEGRADGLYHDEDGRWVVDEIKSTAVDIENLTEKTFPLHWAQAKCYAYMLAEREDLPETEFMTVRLSYIHVETEAVRYLFQTYTVGELTLFWNDLLAAYQNWILWKNEWEQKRDKSLEQLALPFDSFRPGQRTMSAYVYRAIREREKVFLQAPTGIGKTMSALFPALKAMGRGQTEKIFYLTAKTVTGQAAVNAADLLIEKGACLKVVRITAKDRCCPLEKRDCNPESCPYAKGHYDRVNEAVLSALQERDRFDLEVIDQIAQKYQVCPFELTLDIAIWADIIICDYNYAFDPGASLKRFFQDKNTDYVLLVDEAHNLVDRARNMFTAVIEKQRFLDFRAKLPKYSALYKLAGAVNKLFLTAAHTMKENETPILTEEPGEECLVVLRQFTDGMEAYLQQHRDEEIEEEIWELYFQALFFQRIAEKKKGGYSCYWEGKGRTMRYTLFCVDPSETLTDIYQHVRSTIFFSATLMPIHYYKELLGGTTEEKTIALPSPFDPTRKKILTSRVQANYAGRTQSIDAVTQLLYTAVQSKEGHYMVFFPSFAYMEQVKERFTAHYPEEPIICQESQMDEAARESFLRRFTEDDAPVLGFCVLGGLFSEGIDLKGDNLIGVIIVSVGIPQLNQERNLIRDHMDKNGKPGYEYAYQYPGLNKVFQAAGRLIRSEEDAGFVLLLDERFEQERYSALYPPDWAPVSSVNADNLADTLQDFWNQLEMRK